MTRTLGRLGVLAVLAIGLALPTSALAASRTWVSGTGDDANPCSRTAPCKTWAGAYSKTDTGGEIDAIDAGGFGTLTIGKSVTLSGLGTNASILASSSAGVIVNAPAGSIVEIHDVQINGINGDAGLPAGTYGIEFLSGSTLRVDGGSIFGFANQGIYDASSTPGSQLIVTNEDIYSNTGAGVLLTPPAGVAGSAVLDSDHLDGNGCGVAVGAFGAGGGTCGTATSGTAAAGASATTNDTSISDNSGVGVYSGGAPSVNQISNDLITGNGTGLLTSAGGAIVSLGANNVVVGNATNGAATSTVSTGGVAGPSGAAGPRGAAGPAGAAGPSGLTGKIELVTCKKVTVLVKKKINGKTRKVKKIEQKCTGKLVSGPVKFTAAGRSVKATLSRSGVVYAVGTVRVGTSKTEGALTLERKLTRGRYTLTLSHGRTVLSRRTVTSA
jgi:hypothetical protein